MISHNIVTFKFRNKIIDETTFKFKQCGGMAGLMTSFNWIIHYVDLHIFGASLHVLSTNHCDSCNFEKRRKRLQLILV